MTDSPVPEINCETLAAWLANGSVLLVDVREQGEWDADHLSAARLLPLSSFDPSQVPAADDGQKTVIMCRSGRRSADVTRLLKMFGRQDVFNLEGGILAWRDAGLPTVAHP